MMPTSPTVRVRLPAVLRPLAGGRPELRGEGETVGEVLRAIAREHPALGERLIDAEGRLRRYVTFFLNGEDVRHAGGADAPIGAGDELTVVPALSGGTAQATLRPALEGESRRERDAGRVLVDGLERTRAAVAALAERTPCEEVCGFVLAAAGGADAEIVPVRNVAGDRVRGFSMDPREVLAVVRAADARGCAVAAIFHSHVVGGAALSAADRSQLAPDGRPLWPGAELWVVALDGGRAVEVRAYAWVDDRYVEQVRNHPPFTHR